MQKKTLSLQINFTVWPLFDHVLRCNCKYFICYIHQNTKTTIKDFGEEDSHSIIAFARAVIISGTTTPPLAPALACHP